MRCEWMWRVQEKWTLQPDGVLAVDELSELPAQFKILHRGGRLQFEVELRAYSCRGSTGQCCLLIKLA